MKADINSKIDTLAAEVSAGRIGCATPWGGADVVISATPPKPNDPNSFYPDKRHVVATFAGELSWMFESLRDTFGTAIDFQNKFAFYGRLADAADHYLASHPAESQSAAGLLTEVLAEAKLLAAETKP